MSRYKTQEYYREAARIALPLIDGGKTIRAMAERFGVHHDKLSQFVREERDRQGIPASAKPPRAVHKPSGTPCFGEHYRKATREAKGER